MNDQLPYFTQKKKKIRFIYLNNLQMPIFIFALIYKQFTTSLCIFYIQNHSYPSQQLMFYGKQLRPHVPQPLALNASLFSTIQITNAALSKSSQEADLYIKINKHEILVCELSRKLGVLQNSLHVIVDLKQAPQLITKNGCVHVCGYYQAENKNNLVGQNSKTAVQTATNKKTNPLESKFQKTQTLPAQSLETSFKSEKKRQTTEKESPKQPQQTFTPRQSSRLSSRRPAPSSNQPRKPSTTQSTDPNHQRPSKRSQKQQKKSSGQQKALLSNGRYNLKALLQNIEDNDDDSDEESQVVFDEDEEDEDSDEEDFDEDDSEDEEEKRLKKKVKQVSDNDDKKKIKHEEQHKQVCQKQQLKKRVLIEVIQEDSSQKIQGNTQEFQQKWPQNAEEYQLIENSQVDKKIQELASKLKVPTIKPMI